MRKEGETGMSDRLDNFLKELQDEIFEDTLKTYGETAYQRWRNPVHMRAIPNPDAHARITGPCAIRWKSF